MGHGLGSFSANGEGSVSLFCWFQNASNSFGTHASCSSYFSCFESQEDFSFLSVVLDFRTTSVHLMYPFDATTNACHHGSTNRDGAHMGHGRTSWQFLSQEFLSLIRLIHLNVVMCHWITGWNVSSSTWATPWPRENLSLTCQWYADVVTRCNEARAGSNIQRICAGLLLSGLSNQVWRWKYLNWVLFGACVEPCLARTFGELHRCCGVTARRLEPPRQTRLASRVEKRGFGKMSRSVSW